VKITDEKIRCIVKQVVDEGQNTDIISKIQRVSKRRFKQLAKYNKETGKYPVLSMKIIPKTYLSDEPKKIINKAFNKSYLGACLLRYYINSSSESKYQ
jgi:hypothetical protein